MSYLWQLGAMPGTGGGGGPIEVDAAAIAAAVVARAEIAAIQTAASAAATQAAAVNAKVQGNLTAAHLTRMGGAATTAELHARVPATLGADIAGAAGAATGAATAAEAARLAAVSTEGKVDELVLGDLTVHVDFEPVTTAVTALGVKVDTSAAAADAAHAAAESAGDAAAQAAAASSSAASAAQASATAATEARDTLNVRLPATIPSATVTRLAAVATTGDLDTRLPTSLAADVAAARASADLAADLARAGEQVGERDGDRQSRVLTTPGGATYRSDYLFPDDAAPTPVATTPFVED